jgi:iron(III) transport system ATP-binding protein
VTAIRISGLNRRFGPSFAVENLDLEIAAGEFLTLLGPSGSGKTTTLRMLAGLERPDSGTIRVGGRMMNGPGVFVPPHKRNMGMVFQSYAVWPHRTVYQNVAFPLRVQRVSRADEKARVTRIMELVELPAADFADRYASQLSGGQQQRVSLARALVADPDVILYDEPLSNLDARLRDAMRTLLRDIHGRIRTTALYVTHDQTEAMVLSDRVCIMQAGRIVQQGTPRALYDHPCNMFVTEFIGGANTLPITDQDRIMQHVSIAGGVRIHVTNWNAASGSRLVIRHHHVQLLPADTTTDNAIDATVRDAVFLGDRVRFTLQAKDGLTLVADAVAAPGLPATGSRIRAVLPADLCIVI